LKILEIHLQLKIVLSFILKYFLLVIQSLLASFFELINHSPSKDIHVIKSGKNQTKESEDFELKSHLKISHEDLPFQELKNCFKEEELTFFELLPSYLHLIKNHKRINQQI
jgi:hypothetical protein